MRPSEQIGQVEEDSHEYASREGHEQPLSPSPSLSGSYEYDDDDDQEVDVTSTLDAPIPLVSITQRDEPEIKQSLILIEEVDVLYQCDTGFWQALIAIIKECRRPVVLTCNGMFQHNIFGSSHITKWCV